MMAMCSGPQVSKAACRLCCCQPSQEAHADSLRGPHAGQDSDPHQPEEADSQLVAVATQAGGSEHLGREQSLKGWVLMAKTERHRGLEHGENTCLS